MHDSNRTEQCEIVQLSTVVTYIRKAAMVKIVAEKHLASCTIQHLRRLTFEVSFTDMGQDHYGYEYG